MLQERINELQRRIVSFGLLIEMMITEGITGLTERDERKLRMVIDEKEAQANSFELEIEETCIGVIAQFHPMAKELRTILMIYNISGTLERMGDHAVNIAHSAAEIIRKPQIKKYIDIPRMGRRVCSMLSDVIMSFVREDYRLAMEICQRDSDIDGLRDQINRELITFMSENPAIISTCLHIMRIAENLERIADLTTNIGEDIVFMAKGKIIKHHQPDGYGMPEEEKSGDLPQSNR